MEERYFQTGQGRVFLQEMGAGPGHPYAYMGCARLTGLSESLGDITPAYCPDPAAYDKFVVVDEVRGEGGLPTTSLISRFGLVNRILEIECPFDVQAHFGKCEDPTDFNGGWEKIIAYERAHLTARSTDDLTAMTGAERAHVNITGELTARRTYQIDPLVLGEVAEEVATREVVAVVICDIVSCGECGWESLGCNKIYAITKSSGLASPGLPAELLYSEDGGLTWADYDVTTLGTGEDPIDLACVGNYVVVVSADSGSLHYAHKNDLATWYEATTGFVDNPVAIFALSATQVWIVGDAGYVYFTDNVTTGVTVQSDGTAAVGNRLNDVFGSNSQHVIAVGNANTVLMTVNGGSTWTAVTGPAAGVNLNCCWMRTQYCWFVGAANGRLYYTRDQGGSWAEKSFPGSGSGEVMAVAFASNNNSPWGYMAHKTATPAGRILRSLDGGESWYVLPEGEAAIPANDYIGDLAVCRDPNFVVGVGLADDALDGIIVLGS